jgi:hypothetical protein
VNGPGPPPARFPKLTPKRLPAGTLWHRNHLAAYAADAFNPCEGEPGRFSPIRDAAGACIPSLYAADSAEAAAFETVFADLTPGAAVQTVRLAKVLARAASGLVTRRELALLPLFAPDLHALGLARAALIDTPKSAYAATARWAEALHRAAPGAQGLIWTSRRCDPAGCVLLFGDRVAREDLEVVETSRLDRDPALLLTLRDWGQRAGITIIS